MKQALKDPLNKKFILVSDSCIPLVSFDTFYKDIMKDDKTRINIHTGNQDRYDNIKNPPFPKDEFIIHNGSSAAINLNHTTILVNTLLEYKDNWNDTMCPDEYYNGNILRLKDKNFNLQNNPVKITFDTWSKDKLELENICNAENNETLCTDCKSNGYSPKIITKISNRMIDELRAKNFLLIRKIDENTEIDINYLLN